MSAANSVDAMTPLRWWTVLRRVTTEGPYINERLSVSRSHSRGGGGDLCCSLRGQIRGFGFARTSVFPAVSSEALVHPLRISLALSIVCMEASAVRRAAVEVTVAADTASNAKCSV
jgi:hypothetical protein